MSDAKPRVLPHSVEAEEYLLSCILLDGIYTLGQALNQGIIPDSFYVPANRVLYARCMAMMAAGTMIDLVTLHQELTTAKEIDQVGGMNYLIQITGGTPTTAKAAYFIKHVKNNYRLRQLIAYSKQLTEHCYTMGDGDIATVIGAPLTKLLSLTSGEDSAKEEEWGEIVDEAEAAIDSIFETKGLPSDRIIHWPYPEMDESFGPMERGEHIIVGGRPSTGKSSLARDCLIKAAEDGHKCYFVTLEVKPYRAVLSMAQSIARIAVKALGTEAHKHDMADFKNILQRLRAFGIKMSSVDKKMYQIESRARALKAQNKLDLLVVDYGGLIEEIAMANDREKEGMIGQVQKRFKRLAAELDIVVIEPWQINRGMEKDNNREPRISDLKGSGDLEADASRVLLIHRPNSWPSALGGFEQTENSRLADVPKYYINIIQGKGRDQGTSSLSFWFHREITKFEPVRTEKKEKPEVEQDDLPI